MRSLSRAQSPLVHWAKGNRIFSKNEFISHCSGRIKEDHLNGSTYSLSDITCRKCLEEYVAKKEKELSLAKEFLKFSSDKSVRIIRRSHE